MAGLEGFLAVVARGDGVFILPLGRLHQTSPAHDDFVGVGIDLFFPLAKAKHACGRGEGLLWQCKFCRYILEQAT